MSEKLVSYSVQEGVAHIGLNDENRLNVLSKALVADLNNALDTAESDQQVFAIILYGHGRAFCVGGDLKEFVAVSVQPQEDFIKAWERLSHCALPVIAAVHGYAVGGGCELMMMADYKIASSKTKFSQPELKIGFVPGCGATQRFRDAIGFGRAFDLMATGEQISADTAYSIGLIDQVVEGDHLQEMAQNLALSWKKQGRDELIHLKSAMKGDFKTERQLFYKMVAGKKAQNAIKQFLNKE